MLATCRAGRVSDELVVEFQGGHTVRPRRGYATRVDPIGRPRAPMPGQSDHSRVPGQVDGRLSVRKSTGVDLGRWPSLVGVRNSTGVGFRGAQDRRGVRNSTGVEFRALAKSGLRTEVDRSRPRGPEGRIEFVGHRSIQPGLPARWPLRASTVTDPGSGRRTQAGSVTLDDPITANRHATTDPAAFPGDRRAGGRVSGQAGAARLGGWLTRSSGQNGQVPSRAG